MNRLKLWQDNWEEAEKEWDRSAEVASLQRPLKKLTVLPEMAGITPETSRYLKWKSLKWMLTQDHKREILKGILKHPLKYAWAFIKSAWKTKPYQREGDFFLYGIQSIEKFKKLLHSPESILVLGFSYCHKPFECPSGRFTPDCMHDANNPVCQQCFIGKTMHASSNPSTIPLIIPTIHYIGGKIFEIVHSNPGKPVLFIITACEMTLEMFGDWGNMVNLKGIGVRLDGRICNTMKAFELSERGVKPGLTVVLDPTQKVIMDLIRHQNGIMP
ncbi:MAG: hypothetical protein H0V82_06670 [Candidatus Protochlamydia sp.]|nr:hypothetical protein [Candidatus Protochlamydia sp.]